MELEVESVCGDPMSPEFYWWLRGEVLRMGYGEEITWSQNVQPVGDPLSFWCEYAWVVLNSGMKNTIARQIWERVRPRVMEGGSASEVFGHKGKADAIDKVWAEKETLLQEYLKAEEKVEWLETLPWIGPITKWHLAKNFGHDCAKPDRHLVRISGSEGTAALCSRLAEITGDRIATVDLVIWRAASLGLI